jgi:hypothetical protein
MSDIWPYDVKVSQSIAAVNALRPFKCVMLMPFEPRFDQVAVIIREAVSQTIQQLAAMFGPEPPRIERLDWVTSAGVIQQEIWEKILEADLIFCDVTGYNPNVLFESGVAAAWKNLGQVVFIKDHFFKQQSAFDIAPLRYTEYELTSNGLPRFQEQIIQLTRAALIAFPDLQGTAPTIHLPFEVDFKDSRDDLRIYTPPFAHRRVVDGTLEFGSILFFPYSWATIGQEKFLNFELEFSARFSNPQPPNDTWIGVGLRSQHFFANFSHIFYLRRDGFIIITEPNEQPPNFYEDVVLRQATPIDLSAEHRFRVEFEESKLVVELDDFSHRFEVAHMPKVFGPGLIRLQSYRTWMAISHVKLVTK